MNDWTVIAREDKDLLGEGTLWSARDNALYWVDIFGPALNRLSLSDMSVSRWLVPEPLGWIAEQKEGGPFIAGFQSGFAKLSIDPVSISPLSDPEPHYPGNRMNDGKADAYGCIWAGTTDLTERAASGSLYRLNPDHSWDVMDGGYSVPNGPAFSPDGTFIYHADTAHRTIYRFRYDGVKLTDKQPFIRFTETDGYPDGMTTDSEGALWVAHWGGGRISRFDADGKWMRSIVLPASQITNIAFAGANCERMFVSSAAIGIVGEVHAGDLFEVEPGVRGRAPYLFGRP